MAEMLPFALEYARWGLPVFPLHTALQYAGERYVCSCGKVLCGRPAKHPLARYAPNGLLNATAAENVVRHWWSSAPNANIGLRTGTIIVLDVDPRHGGDAALAALEHKQGLLPLTWRALTGGGGQHIYFAAPAEHEIRNSAGVLGAGLDVRGVGGYVIAPPSMHISGRRYVWAVDHGPPQVPLSPMPEWLRAAASSARSQGGAHSSSEWRTLVREGVSDGARNAAITRLSGLLLRRYVDPEVAHELVQAWNACRCRPPLSSEEVTKTVGSIARKELRRREARRG